MHLKARQPDIIEIGHMNPGRWLRIAKIMTEHQRIIDESMLNRFTYDSDKYQPNLSRYLRIATVSSLLALLLAGISTWIYRTNRRLQREITARQQAELQLRHLSETDALTGLANRRAFDLHMTQEFQRFLRYRHPFSVVMIDIDWFKRINDTFGHAAGDHVLTEFAWRLRDHIRKTDFLARIGGEEFAILDIDRNPVDGFDLAKYAGNISELHGNSHKNSRRIKAIRCARGDRVCRHEPRRAQGMYSGETVNRNMSL
jgi:diguanylate cyclase (GGDEF)-like protein